jgi:hypothetical protein
VGFLVYALVLMLLRVPEVRMLFESVKKRLAKQPR